MLDQVENKLKELEKQQKNEYSKKKEEDLTRWGFRKNKKSLTVVTDEEYDAMIEALNKTEDAGSSNKIARIMNAGSVFVAAFGIVGAIVLSIMQKELGFLFFSLVAFASVLLAILFRGVGEAIRLLQQLIDIRRVENAKKEREPRDDKSAFPEQQPQTADPLGTMPPVVQGFDNSFNF